MVIKLFKITELLLNSQNPRFNPVNHQTEAIAAMVEDQKDKLVVLAKHIFENGLNPTENILITSHGKQWLVLEGNRRITALKLMNQPELVSDKHSKIKTAFKQLNASLDYSLVEKIPCVVVEDEEIANQWILLRHTGENSGAGTVNWNAVQSTRFKNRISGKVDGFSLFLEELKTLKIIPQNYKDNFGNIKKTNFDRLMSDPDIRTLLGISSDEGKYYFINGVNQYFLEVLYDLAITDLSVGFIYLKKDRTKYINDIKDRVKQKSDFENDTDLDEGRETELSTDGTHFFTDNTNDNFSNTGSNTPQTPLPKKVKNYPINRKTLIPSTHKLTISHGRILKIFNELKDLDINEYPNAAAVSFRVFVELSADCYILKNAISSVNENSHLANKITAIADDFETQKIMTKHELQVARRMSSSATQNSSVKTFHSYVHSKDSTPAVADLKSAWDDLWPFIENVWRQII